MKIYILPQPPLKRTYYINDDDIFKIPDCIISNTIKHINSIRRSSERKRKIENLF